MRRRLYHQDTVGEHLTQLWRRSGLYRGTKELKDLVKAPFKTEKPLTPEDNQTIEGNSQVAERLTRIFQQEFPTDLTTPPEERPDSG